MNKLDGKTMDLIQQNIAELKKLFPEAITEGKIDFDRLRLLLGDEVDTGKEKYEFTWPGKSDCIRLSQQQSTGTLRPDKESSKDWDTTQNLYIEGDNLEVLRLLQKAYHRKVKMIYIDPPYNTGNDFIYNDDFKDNVKSYKEKTEQSMKANPETSGRYHTDWLNMIYPRLRLARNLLMDEGVIFISIDDNEVDNLKKMCDEVFGESNFIGIITWSKKRKGSFLTKKIISQTEYLVVYTKEINNVFLFGGQANNAESQPIIKRTNSISTLKIGAGLVSTKLNDGTYSKGIYGSSINPVELLDDVIFKNGKNINSFRIKAPFVWSQEFLDAEIEKGTQLVVNTMNFQIRVFRVYEQDNFKGFPSYIDGVKIKGTNEDAYEELEKIFKTKNIFEYSKPVNYLKELINAVTFFDKDSIILDFFSGSATTAHAVMQLNADDGGNRKFIMVQLPEPCNEDSEAYKAGFSNICEIGTERIRRGGENLKEENKDKEGIENLDTGFKVFKLDTSNLKAWDPDVEELEETLKGMVDPIKEGRTQEDMLYEIMLKYGIDLTMPLEEIQIKGKAAYSIGLGYMIVCLEDGLTLDFIEAIGAMKQSGQEIARVVFRDSGFADDNVKTNAVQLLKKFGIEDFRTI